MRVLLLVAIAFFATCLAADEKRHHPDRTRRTEVRCFPVPEPPVTYCTACPRFGTCDCHRGPYARKFEVFDFDTGERIGCCVADSVSRDGQKLKDASTGRYKIFRLIED